MYDFKYSAASFHALEGTTLFNSATTGLNECDWNQFLDFHNECVECDATCTQGCTTDDVCFECHPTCRTCTGHKVDECVDCWCGASVDSDGCCTCDSADGFEPLGDKCEQTGCFTEGCDACDKGICIHCAYGYDLHDGECHQCREQDCDDLNLLHLPNCSTKGIRHDTGFCNCDGSHRVDENMCRVCSMGCADCSIDVFGRPVCNVCNEGYVKVDDMPHLCAFLQDDTVIPIGYVHTNSTLITSDEF